MPNDCWNSITITGSKEDIERFVEQEFIDETGDPIPSWALKIQHRGPEGIMLRLWSAWHPEYSWLEGLLDTYPSFWIKNLWDEEGGMEGVWIGTWANGSKHIQRLEWQGMSLEESYYRFTNPGCSMYYVMLDEQKRQLSKTRFLDIPSLFRAYLETGVKGSFWAMRIDEIGFERVEEFPDLEDPEVRRACGV